MIKLNDHIVVTGANGLVGSAVVQHLTNEGYRCVIPITRQTVDLMDAEFTSDWFINARPKYVFHAAATVFGLGGNMANQGKAIYENTTINSNVIHACHRAGSVEKLTVMGSNCVYPATASVPYQEQDIFNGRPHEGESGYGHAKRHMLAMLEAYRQSYGHEFTYVVSGNIYGPNDRFDPVNGHVIPSLIRKFADAKKSGGGVEIWGDGSVERDLLYSKDLARAVEMLMSPDVSSGPVNTGFGRPVSIRHVVKTLCEISGVSFDRVRFDISKPSGRLNTANNLRHIGVLGFLPRYPLSIGLRETWDWFTTAK